MKDVRSLYINQLLNHYRQKSVFDSIELYPVTYRYENADKPTCLYFRHNEGLDAIRDYIKSLENKVDELQYVERIIKVAKEKL
jgi:hypothetical protein